MHPERNCAIQIKLYFFLNLYYLRNNFSTRCIKCKMTMMKNRNSTTFGSLLLLLYFSIFRFCISDVKVVDLIQFNGDVLANLRYKYLEGVIDLFVIVEGTYTFSGFRKEKLYINIHEDWFKEIEDVVSKSS